MSCARTPSMEAVVMGEIAGTASAELRAHAAQCALCRHELNWLQSEASIFRQHAARAEVAHLWAGVRRVPMAKAWSKALVALLLAGSVTLWLLARTGAAPASNLAGSAGYCEEAESSPRMSSASFARAHEPWSRLPSGVGFRCSQELQASFLASRN